MTMHSYHPLKSHRLALLSFVAGSFALSACQTADMSQHTVPQSTQLQPGISASDALHAELMAEATALGASQAAAGIAASLDKTGIASIPVAIGGGAARKAWMTSGRARMQAAQEVDKQAFYKKYGMNPDGTPSGVRGPGSAAPE